MNKYRWMVESLSTGTEYAGLSKSGKMPKEESMQLIRTDKVIRMLMILGLSAATAGCKNVDEESKDSESETAQSDSDVDADTDSDSDSDSDTDTDTDTDADADSETETDPEMLACFDRYSGCTECMGDCMDGFGYEVNYPEDAWVSDTDSFSISPSAELEAASVTYYFCSVCGNCGKELKIRPLDEYGTPGDWKDVTYREFCQYLLDYNKACDDCLETWYGGAGK
jgi:hypothetical protein